MRAVIAFVLLACLAATFTRTPALAQKFEADLVIINADIFKIAPVEIEKTRVRLTITDGRVVCDAVEGGAAR